MNCKYSANGSYSCSDNTMENIETIETFVPGTCNPGKQNLPLPYMGRTNCKDACSYYAYINSCPVMMTGNKTNRKSGICKCPAERK